jgi:hypothetical protein
MVAIYVDRNKEVTMVKKSLIIMLAGSAILVATGCQDTRQVRSSGSFRTVDIAHGQDKGYVEFFCRSNNVAVPIYSGDVKDRAVIVGAVGLEPGDHYSRVRYETEVTSRLRVAVAPGKHTFLVERDGQRIEVPVQAGRVTPVAIDYVLLERADNFDVYRVNAEVGASMAPSDAPKTAPVGK